MESDKTSVKYQDLLNKLPRKYIDCYHELIQVGAHFIIVIIICRRGNENFDTISKEGFFEKIRKLLWPSKIGSKKEPLLHILSPKICELHENTRIGF
jgi:hypothetical protein